MTGKRSSNQYNTERLTEVASQGRQSPPDSASALTVPANNILPELAETIPPSMTSTTILLQSGKESPAPVSKLPTGTLLGQRYRIEQVLGKGGFGEAYLATDMQLHDRKCVVKRLVINPLWDQATQQIVRSNFQREAHLLVEINSPGHPHIPDIYEYLEEDACLVMKFIVGQSLGHILRDRHTRLNEIEVLRYTTDVCSALVYIHSRMPEAVLHRDIKPDNILLDAEQRVWLIDFGLARSLPFQDTPEPQHHSLAAGTPGYSAPEQWRGEAVPKSDVYSLAATLYTLLTGNVCNSSEYALLKKYHATAQSPLCLIDTLIRADLEALLIACLDPLPESRPTSSEMLKDLRKLLLQIDIPSPPRITRLPDIHGFVGRQEELADLGARLANNRLAVILGMAGVGKTALAVQLALRSSDPLTTFWYTFHTHTSIEELIWSLAAFLARQGHPATWTLLQRARQSGTIAPPGDVLLDNLLHTLEHKRYLLCFDDFQYVDADPAMQQFMSQLRIRLQPNELALIVTTRQKPVFARDDEVSVLNGMNRADTALLLQHQHVDLPDQMIDELHRRTGGNATFLILTASVLQQNSNATTLLANLSSVANVEAYLLGQVDAGLYQEERNVMQAMATLLGYAGTADVLAAMLNQPTLPRTLRELGQRNLLLFSDEETGREYRQHAIVQSFYYQGLDLERRRFLHRQAGAYYEASESNRLLAALHLQQGQVYQRAAELVTTNIYTTLNQGQPRLLRQVLEAFQPRHVDQSHWVGICVARGALYALIRESTLAHQSYQAALAGSDLLDVSAERHYFRSRIYQGMGELLEYEAPHQALEWLQRGLAELADQDTLTEALLRLRMGAALMSLSDYDQARDQLEQCLQLLPATSIARRADALVNLGAIACMQGSSVQGKHFYAQALEIYRQLHDPLGEISTRHNMAIEMEIAGEWASAATYLEQALEQAHRLGSITHQVNIEQSLGILRMNQNASEAAYVHLSRCIDLSRRHALNEQLVNALSSQGDLFLRQHQPEAAQPLFLEAEQIAQSLDMTYLLPEIYRGQALCFLEAANLSAAQQVSQQSLDIARELKNPYEEGISLRVSALGAYQAGNVAAAIPLLDQSLDLLQHTCVFEAARTCLVYGSILCQSIDHARGDRMLARGHTLLQSLDLPSHSVSGDIRFLQRRS